MNEKTKNLIFFWAFVVVWGAIALWNGVTPAQEFSEAENRYLKKFPKFTVATMLDGKFEDDVNTYLNDHFAGRPYWVSGQSLAEFVLGKREINSVYIGNNALLGDMSKPDEAVTDKNIAGINAFAQEHKIPVYATLVPSAAAIQPEKLPPFAAVWDERGYIDGVYSKLSAAVTTVDVYNALAVNGDKYIYYRTDHHWTTYGAYLAYDALTGPMGLKPRTRGDFAVNVVSNNFLGTYHSKTGFPLVNADVMERYRAGEAVSFEVFDGIETKTYDDIYFDEFLTKKDKYSYFLGQVQPYVTITTKSDSGRRIIIFKDSYAHCLTPMLLGDFSEIRLVDLRFINADKLDTMLDIKRYNEALFIYSTDVFSHQNGAGMLYGQ